MGPAVRVFVRGVVACLIFFGMLTVWVVVGLLLNDPGGIRIDPRSAMNEDWGVAGTIGENCLTFPTSGSCEDAGYGSRAAAPGGRGMAVAFRSTRA